MNFDQPLDCLTDNNLLDLEQAITNNIQVVEDGRFVFNPRHNGGLKMQQRNFYDKQNAQLVKLNRYRKSVIAELDKRTNPFKTVTTTVTTVEKAKPLTVVPPSKPSVPVSPTAAPQVPSKIVYKAPVEDKYLLAEAFMIVSQKGLPAAHYQRLLNLAIDRRTLQTNRPASLVHSAT